MLTADEIFWWLPSFWKIRGSIISKEGDVGETMVIVACNSWPLRHSYDATADAWVTRWLQVLSAHGTGDVSWDAWSPQGHHTATVPLAPVRRPYRHRTVSVRVSCGCSREISHRRRMMSWGMWPRKLRSPRNRTMSKKRKSHDFAADKIILRRQ